MIILRLLRPYSKLLFALAGVVFIIGGTLFALRWARGYRPSLGKNGPTLAGTGLFVATSDPKGAQVFINGKLTTATDDTLNLPPGTYSIEIKKDGYIPWKKNLDIVAELVTQTNTKLFPSVPNLTPLTFTGADSPMPSPDGQRIVYKVSSASTDARNGLWVLDLAERNFTTARTSEPKQIARNTSQYNFLDATLLWTPDSSQVLAYWTETQNAKLQHSVSAAVLLSVSGMNDEGDIKDVTSRLPVLLAGWHQELDLKDQERFKELPPVMRKIATESAAAMYFSPDEKRFLYTATQEIIIPDRLIPDLPSESTQQEDRQLKPGGVYIYDMKEDRNYKVGDVELKREEAAAQQLSADDYWPARLATNFLLLSEPEANAALTTSLPPVPADLFPSLLTQLRDRYSPIWAQPIQWFPTSAHLLTVTDASINIAEYDGINSAVVYAGPFTQSFVYPWPNGGRLIILASLNAAGPANLYAINLR